VVKKKYLKKNEKSSFFFIAPEILRGEPFSASSDMWQLGILIFFW